jgi:hypothetical protein
LHTGQPGDKQRLRRAGVPHYLPHDDEPD